MNPNLDVRIEQRWYDAGALLTVLLFSFQIPGESKRRFAKGCALCSPQDALSATKAEGTLVAFEHAMELTHRELGEAGEDRHVAELYSQVLRALVRGGYLNVAPRFGGSDRALYSFLNALTPPISRFAAPALPSPNPPRGLLGPGLHPSVRG